MLPAGGCQLAKAAVQLRYDPTGEERVDGVVSRISEVLMSFNKTAEDVLLKLSTLRGLTPIHCALHRKVV